MHNGSGARTIYEMLSKGNYDNWDFNNIWDIKENRGSLPYIKGMEIPSEILEENLVYEKDGESSTAVPDGYIGIYTAEDLANVANNPSGNYIVMADIDMTDKEYNIVENFTGIFDGNFHTISNLSIESSSESVGMFSCDKYMSNIVIKDMTLSNITLTATSPGATVGVVLNDSSKYTKYEISGIKVEGITINCTEDCTVGGIVGKGSVSDSYVKNINIQASGNNNTIGGIVGEGSAIKSFSKNINIQASGDNNIIGGAIGVAIGGNTIYSMGNITVSNSTNTVIGGLIGSVTGNNYVTNAFSTVSIKVTEGNEITVGKLIGRAEGRYISHTAYYVNINRAYATGKIELNGSISTVGLFGDRGTYVNVSDSYDINEDVKRLSFTEDDDGEIRRFTEQMLNEYAYNNWQLSSLWAIEEDGKSLPYFRDMERPDEVLAENLEYQKFMTVCEGSGTKEDPFIIDSLEKLKIINYYDGDIYLKLACDFDFLEIKDFAPIGTENIPFSSHLDCDNHTISNLTIESSDNYVGLFWKNAKGTIGNLKLENLNIISNYNGEKSFVGGVTGYNSGKLYNIEIDGKTQNIGNVTDLFIGEIAGYNNAVINDSKINGTTENAGNVTNLYMGQVAGQNNGSIGNTHANGIVQNSGNTEDACIGGITGYNTSAIKLSYNTGKIMTNNINNLFVGGIAGRSDYTFSTATSGDTSRKYIGTISYSYSKGTQLLNANNVTVGGIIGYAKTAATNETYSIDSIDINSSNIISGGIVGKEIKLSTPSWNGVWSNSYPQVGIKKSYSSIEGIEDTTYRTLEELKQQNTFEDWDFERVWEIKENIDTPKIRIDNSENNYHDDNYWDIYTSYTLDDGIEGREGYHHGNHVIIDDCIKFYARYQSIDGYYDWIFKDYPYAGEKKFKWQTNANQAGYMPGFIFNAKILDNKLSGYILYSNNNLNGTYVIAIFRVDNIDINTGEGSIEKIADYATNSGSWMSFRGSTAYNIEFSPTHVTVIGAQNYYDKEDNIIPKVIDIDLDYSKHVGDGFGFTTWIGNTLGDNLRNI